MLQCCSVAVLQCCTVAVLQCCSVAVLQCCSVALLQCCSANKRLRGLLCGNTDVTRFSRRTNQSWKILFVAD